MIFKDFFSHFPANLFFYGKKKKKQLFSSFVMFDRNKSVRRNKNTVRI